MSKTIYCVVKNFDVPCDGNPTELVRAFTLRERAEFAAKALNDERDRREAAQNSLWAFLAAWSDGHEDTPWEEYSVLKQAARKDFIELNGFSFLDTEDCSWCEFEARETELECEE